MATSDKGRPGLNLESWLARKIRDKDLRGLPPYLAHGGGVVHWPEPFARLLLTSLREPPNDARAAERLKDDARAFRSWVEGNQIELAPIPVASPSPSSRAAAPRR